MQEAADAYREAGGRGLIFVLCTSAYPTPPEDVGLRRLPALAKAFNCPVGFSDHTEGVVAAVGAVALGACFLEKHFTIDRNLPGPDQRFSSDPSEFRALVDAVRHMELALGSSELAPQAAEERARTQFRLSCVASGDLPAGHRLAEEDITFRRPATGLPPSDADQLVGRTLVRAVRRGEQFQTARLPVVSAFNPIWEKEIYGQGRQLGRYPYDAVVSFVFRYAPRDRERSAVRILEIGCGAGNNLWFAAREGFSVTGIDGSATAIDYARKRFAEEGLSGDLRVGDFTALPFEDNEL